MTLKDLRKLVNLAFDSRGGWEAYRAREKAQAELLHYMPILIGIVDYATRYLEDSDDIALAELQDALKAFETK